MTIFRYFAYVIPFFYSAIFAGYHSQYGQDQYLHKHYFKNKKDGFFLELGAYDGVTISNTLFLEEEYHWKGICIEPMTEHYKKLTQNRNCICVNACISDIEDQRLFHIIHIDESLKKANKHAVWSEMLSGIPDEYCEKNRALVKSALKRFKGRVELLPIKTRTLQSVFDEYEVRKVDFISLDTEGGELKILKGIDFEKVQIGVIMVENNTKLSDIKKFLIKKGFCFDRKLHNDEIYYNPALYRRQK